MRCASLSGVCACVLLFFAICELEKCFKLKSLQEEPEDFDGWMFRLRTDEGNKRTWTLQNVIAQEVERGHLGELSHK